MYVTLDFLATGMNIQHAKIAELQRLANDKKAWNAQFDLLRTQLVEFYANADIASGLKAWGLV